MIRSRIRSMSVAWLVAIGFGALSTASAWGQAAGVYVDSDGVLREKVREQSDATLHDQRRRARRPTSVGEAATPSALRKVSIVRLAAALSQVLSAGQPIPEEMRNLAGLHSIHYVFAYPESSDVVIAGPAEGWMTDEAGRVVGAKTGRPVILLDDLAVALRAFRPDSESPVVGCSFEPTADGLARVQDVVGQVKAVERDPNFMDGLIDRLRAAQGAHDIRVFGVPADTHLALVMVEADYRLKRIGIDLESAPVPRFQSYLDFAVRGGGGGGDGDLFNRWWFVPQYEAIERSADGNAYRLKGQRLQILTEMDYLDATGQRTASGKVNRASLQYAEHFTKRYREIAAAVPVYAALENVVDLVLAASILQREDLPARIGADIDALVSPEHDFVERFEVPRQVEPSVNYRFKKRGVILSVGGGVVLNVNDALRNTAVPSDSERTLETTQQTSRPQSDRRWWWD